MYRFAFFTLLLLNSAACLLAQPEVSFELRPLPSAGDSWQFDLYASASREGTFHSRGQVYVLFNPEAVSGSEGDITLIPLQLTSGQGAGAQSDKYMARAMLNSSDRLVITWFASFLGIPGSPEFHTEMPTAPAPLFRVSIPKSGSSDEPGFELDQKLTAGQTFFLMAGEAREEPYR